MKTLLSTILALILVVSTAAQRRISYGYTEVNIAQYDTCRKAVYLSANVKISKQAGKLIVPVTGKPAKLFEYVNSDEDYHEFTYLGDIEGAEVSLVKRVDYNGEEFYLLDRSTGAIDTLIGEPVFAGNMRDFACISNPSTDEMQWVQICEVENGLVRTRGFLRGKPDTLLEGIACVNHNFLLARDNQGKYWRLSFRIGEE